MLDSHTNGRHLMTPRLRRWEFLVQCHATYWRCRRRLRQVSFVVAKSRFELGSWAETRMGWLAIGWQVLRTIFGQLLLAWLIVGLIVLLERLAIPRVIEERFGSGNSSTDDSYGELLSGAAQISGVFLGLYFTSVSIVVSTAYARVPADIRMLLLREQVGNLYIRVVALFGAVSWTLLALLSLGVAPLWLGVVFVAILGVLSILSFVMLGIRSFQFFDPSLLAQSVLQDIHRWASLATMGTRSSEDPNFQSHYRRQADRLSQTYARICMLMAEGERTGDATKRVLLATLTFIVVYAQIKSNIPPRGDWYKQKWRYGDWLTGDVHSQSIYLAAGVDLPPVPEPNLMWLEDELLNAASPLMDALIEEGELRDVYEVIEGARRPIGILADRWRLDEAMLVLAWCQSVVASVDSLPAPPAHASRTTVLQKQALLGIADLHGLLVIDLILGCTGSLADPAQTLDVRWIHLSKRLRGREAIAIPRPDLVLVRVADLLRRVANEESIEGRSPISPWFAMHYVAYSYCCFVERLVIAVRGALDTLIAEAESLDLTTQGAVGATLASRAVEAIRKQSYLLTAAETFDVVMREHQLGGDVPAWTMLEWDEVHALAAYQRQRVELLLARLLPVQAGIAQTLDMPDTFGYLYSQLGEALYAAAHVGDSRHWMSLFRPVVVSGIHAVGQAVDGTSRYEGFVRDIVVQDILADLAAMSGIAIVFSELGRLEIGDEIGAEWLTMLSTRADSMSAFGAIVASVESRNLMTPLSPRLAARSQWAGRLTADLREAGISTNLYHPDRRRPPVSGTGSPLVAAWMLHSPFLLDPAYVFLAWFISRNLEYGDIVGNGQLRDFMDSVDRLSRTSLPQNGEH